MLSARVRYLQAELDALACTDAPDPFWAHLCECIDGWDAPRARPVDDDESLAASQRQIGDSEEDNADFAAQGETGEVAGSEQLR